jgi:hypothetical protein
MAITLEDGTRATFAQLTGGEKLLDPKGNTISAFTQVGSTNTYRSTVADRGDGKSETYSIEKGDPIQTVSVKIA